MKALFVPNLIYNLFCEEDYFFIINLSYTDKNKLSDEHMNIFCCIIICIKFHPQLLSAEPKTLDPLHEQWTYGLNWVFFKSVSGRFFSSKSLWIKASITTINIFYLSIFHPNIRRNYTMCFGFPALVSSWADRFFADFLFKTRTTSLTEAKHTYSISYSKTCRCGPAAAAVMTDLRAKWAT